MKRIALFIVLSVVFNFATFCQSVKVTASDLSLDKVLKTLAVEISFDPVALSSYPITINQEFDSPKSAIDFLLQDKPYLCNIIGTVYVISPKPTDVVAKEEVGPQYRDFVGVVVDANSGERMPYTLIASEKGAFYTNQEGVFKLKLLPDESVSLQLHYLGYQVLDSIINNQVQIIFPLKAIAAELKEIAVVVNLNAMRMQQGQSVGEVRVNHNVAKFMPGNGDNSVFNLLHLMPGVRASGEPSDELIVWGSGSGESKITLDGFTVFGLCNFNDNIGPVNPFIVKDIRLHKAGYNALLGEQVGAIAEITGLSGNTTKPTFKINVNNLTANVMGTFNFGTRASLLVAARKTFYELFDAEKLNPYKRTDSTSVRQLLTSTSPLFVVPKYSFHDINAKFSGTSSVNDSYFLSVYTSKDAFNYKVTNFKRINLQEDADTRQFGAGASYSRVWGKSGVTTFSTNLSSLNRSEDHLSGVLVLNNSKLFFSNTANRVNEFRVQGKHQIVVKQHSTINFGASVLRQATTYNDSTQVLSMPILFATHEYSNGKFYLDYGIRLDAPRKLKSALQPRINLGYQLSPSIKFTLGGGLYRQFLQQAPLIDQNGAYQFVWSVANDRDVPTLKSTHLIGGVSYQHNDLLISVEGYQKLTAGIVALQKSFQQVNSYITKSQATGADLFFKYEFGRLTSFGSASLCQLTIKKRDVQQEYKGGMLLNLKPFYLATNYVWGTGFSYLGSASFGNSTVSESQEEQIYQRLDGSITYRLNTKHFNLQMGVSVLNILNSNNLKYRYQVPPSKVISGNIENVFTSAIPFTPTFFLELGF